MFAYGSNFLFISLSLKDFSPIASGSGRIVLAGFFSILFAFSSGHYLPNNKTIWFYSAFYGIFCLTLPLLLIPYALKSLDTSVVAIFLSSIPLFVLFLARVILKENISLKKWIGFIIGMLGLVLLAGPESFFYGKPFLFIPSIICILVSFLLALGGVVIQIMPKCSPVSLTAGAFFIGGIISMPILIYNIPSSIPFNSSLYGLISVGLFSTFLGNLFRFILVRRAGIVFTSINGYLSPIVACILGVIFLNENINYVTYFCFFIILFGVFISQELDKKTLKLFKREDI